jgi:hypothetical protein
LHPHRHADAKRSVTVNQDRSENRADSTSFQDSRLDLVTVPYGMTKLNPLASENRRVQVADTEEKNFAR